MDRTGPIASADQREPLIAAMTIFGSARSGKELAMFPSECRRSASSSQLVDIGSATKAFSHEPVT